MVDFELCQFQILYIACKQKSMCFYYWIQHKWDKSAVASFVNLNRQLTHQWLAIQVSQQQILEYYSCFYVMFLCTKDIGIIAIINDYIRTTLFYVTLTNLFLNKYKLTYIWQKMKNIWFVTLSYGWSTEILLPKQNDHSQFYKWRIMKSYPFWDAR